MRSVQVHGLVEKDHFDRMTGYTWFHSTLNSLQKSCQPQHSSPRTERVRSSVQLHCGTHKLIGCFGAVYCEETTD